MRRGRGRLHVFTFKDGMLSAVAHDLRFSLDEFEVTLDGTTLHAELDLTKLHVEGSVTPGTGEVADYDPGKRADVDEAMHKDVLKTRQHPRAVFRGTAAPEGTGFRVEGQLELAGTRAPLTFTVASRDGDYAGRFDLSPSRWGIAPYKAMLGTLRVKDVVRIQLAVAELGT